MSRDSIDDGLSIQGSRGGRFAPEPDIADATGIEPPVEGPQEDRSRPIVDLGRSMQTLSMSWVKRAARRVRVKSIILSGHRKASHLWSDWLRWELFKAMLPIIPMVLFEVRGISLPTYLWITAIAAFLGYYVFVLLQAGLVAFELNDRRAAFLKRAGYDLTLASVMLDRKAWQLGPAATMRDFLRTRRPSRSKDRQPRPADLQGPEALRGGTAPEADLGSAPEGRCSRACPKVCPAVGRRRRIWSAFCT